MRGPIGIGRTIFFQLLLLETICENGLGRLITFRYDLSSVIARFFWLCAFGVQALCDRKLALFSMG